MAHAERLLAILAQEDARQKRITEVRQRPASVRLREALTKADREIERTARLLREQPP